MDFFNSFGRLALFGKNSGQKKGRQSHTTDHKNLGLATKSTLVLSMCKRFFILCPIATIAFLYYVPKVFIETSFSDHAEKWWEKSTTSTLMS